jgi:hypothetical protein
MENKHLRQIVILDFDDTLLPSSFIIDTKLHKNKMTIPVEISQELNILQDEIRQFLSTIIKSSLVYIVTNADTEWFTENTNRFLPKLSTLFQTIPMIPAKTDWQHLFPASFPDSNFFWKYCALKTRVAPLLNGLTMNSIISVGDLRIDGKAVEHLKYCCDNIQTKTIKLLEKPTIRQLIDQIKTLNEKWNGIVERTGTIKYFFKDSNSLITSRVSDETNLYASVLIDLGQIKMPDKEQKNEEIEDKYDYRNDDYNYSQFPDMNPFLYKLFE